jgi:intracellular sulfur oxidation DsrE/DsrF family protein
MDEVRMSKQSSLTQERRSFFARLNVQAASLAAFAMGGVAFGKAAKDKSAPSTRFEPARHEKDDWLDKLPGKHRLIFDTTNSQGVAESLLFANNFLLANRTDYGLNNKELAVVIVMRHLSTPFAFNDAMWAKYGTALAARAQFVDPKTKQTPTGNSYAHGDGATLDALSKLGIQLAVCAMATRFFATGLAEATGGTVDAVYNELTSNLVVPTSRMVPAGIVAVNRAQERGYSLVTT